MLSFVKSEKQFLVALIAIIIEVVFIDIDTVLYSEFVTILVFILLLVIIIYSAFGIINHANALVKSIGETYGHLALTLSTVALEIIILSTIMIHGEDEPTLARDSIYSALMILMNGLIGVSLFIGGIKYKEQRYNIKSADSYFSMLIGLIGIGIFLPNYVQSNYYFRFEGFIIIIFILLYIFFLKVQIKEHHYYFVFENKKIPWKKERNDNEQKPKGSIFYHFLMIILILGAIGYLSEILSVVVDNAMEISGLPYSLGGVFVAIVVLSPEVIIAISASLKNDVQSVINISLGKTLSMISLTIPAILLISYISHREITLGVSSQQGALIIISILTGMHTCKENETNSLHGLIHIALFITFIYLLFV